MDLDTTLGDNWTVVVIYIESKRWHDILVKIYEHLTELHEALLPHHSFRGSIPGKFVIISLRILRKKEDALMLTHDITEFMKGMELDSYKIDPEKEDGKYGQYHCWFRKGHIQPHWTEERCIILNNLSSLVFKAVENNVFDTSCRAEWAHLLVNMLGLQEAIKSQLQSQFYYFDMITSHNPVPYYARML